MALAVAAGLLLTACTNTESGGQNSSTPSDPTSSEAPATSSGTIGASSSATATSSDAPSASSGGASEDALAKVRALLPARFAPGSKIRVGVRDDSAPNEFRDSSGNLVGYEIELMTEVAKTLDLDIDYMVTPFNTLIPTLQADRVDVAFGALGTNPERQKVAQFVSWVGSQGSMIALAKNNTTIKTMDDLCGLSMSSTLGGQTTTFAQEYSDKCVAKGKPPIDIQTFKSTNEDLLAVKSGRADIWYGSGVNVAYIAKTSNGELVVAGSDDHDPVPLGITILKGSDIVPAVHAAVDYVVHTPKYKAILAKWGLDSAAITGSLLYPQS